MMNTRKGRPSFLRPLTQIAPQEGTPSSTPGDLGPTSKGSIASASHGARPRSQSLAGKIVGHAAPTSAIGGAGGSVFASPASSRASSRHSSFAPYVSGHRRPSMVARDATMSRRDSVWSTFGEDAVAPGGSAAPLTQEEKAVEARKAFVSSMRTIWESGVNRIATDLWASLVHGWKSGDIVGLLSIDNLGLTRIQHAHAVVHISELSAQLQTLAALSSTSPAGIKAIKSLDSEDFNAFFDFLSTSPEHVALLLRSLDTLAKLCLEVLPSLIVRLEYPDSLNPAFFSLMNLVTFLTGSSTDLRRALVSLLHLVSEVAGVVDSTSRAIVHIVAQLPTAGAIPHPAGTFLFSPQHSLNQFTEIQQHLQTLLAQPVYVRALDVFSAELRSTWNGLVGNARVARAARGAERIWKNTSSSYKYKLASLLEALDVIEWEITPISSDNEEFSYAFSGLKPHFPALVPDDVSVSYAHSGFDAGAPSSITLKGMHIVVKAATYHITKRGLLGFTDSGTAGIVVPFDLDIDFASTTDGAPTLVPRMTGKVDIQLTSARNAGASPSLLTKVWNAWLSTVVSSKVSESIEERLSTAFRSWLEPLFGAPVTPANSVAQSVFVPGSTIIATPAAMTPAFEGTTTDRAAYVATPGSVSLSRQASLSRQWSMSLPSNSAVPSPSLKSPPQPQSQVPLGAPIGARAAFLASLRMSSGIDIRPLATGRDVLESLANPFSGPNSAIGNLAGDDDDEGDGSNAGGLKSRSMSMAMSLTDMTRSDSTALANIENPPRSRTLSQVIFDDGPQVFDRSSSLANRRLSLAYTPAGEPSLDAYDKELGPPDASALDPSVTEHDNVIRGRKQRKMSMAEHLDERSQFDTTTPEGLIAQAHAERAKKSTHGFSGGSELESSRANVSMTRVTMDLQGHKTPVEPEYEAAALSPRRHEAHSGVDHSASNARRKSMSEYLSEQAMTDTTDPTVNPGPRRPSTKENETIEHRPSMSSALDHISSMDMTLPENIVSPPKSRTSSFAPTSGISTRSRTKSFMALDDVPSMAEIGVDARITRDETDAASSPGGARRKSQAAEEYAGIDPAELKKKRMSSFMTDATNIDTTLVQNIQTPPAVDQSYHEVASKPHSLASRRQSATSGKA